MYFPILNQKSNCLEPIFYLPLYLSVPFDEPIDSCCKGEQGGDIDCFSTEAESYFEISPLGVSVTFVLIFCLITLTIFGLEEGEVGGRQCDISNKSSS